MDTVLKGRFANVTQHPFSTAPIKGFDGLNKIRIINCLNTRVGIVGWGITNKMLQTYAAQNRIQAVFAHYNQGRIQRLSYKSDDNDSLFRINQNPPHYETLIWYTG